MMGMEMLISNMLGIKPEEMKTIVTEVMQTIKKAGDDITYIRCRLDELHPNILVEETENDGKSNGRVEL